MNEKDKRMLTAELASLGYPLLENEAVPDAETILTNMLKSGDERLLEGFPVVLANILADEKINFSMGKLEDRLNMDERSVLIKLVVLALALFGLYNYRQVPAVLKEFELSHADEIRNFRDGLAHGRTFTLGAVDISSERVKNIFMNYVLNKNLYLSSSRKEQVELKDEFTTEFYLSKLFSPKQKDIIAKKLSGRALNKTEREYYSRSVKKKVLAIANSGIRKMAEKLLQS